ncbi:MAG: alkaline phosphatase D family protein [Flavobacteriales bacterium]|nr:alkaline phosphatase D family protein [Flavobacteriales bacterium]
MFPSYPLLFFLISCFIYFPLSAQYISHGPVIGGITHESAKIFVRTGFDQPFILEWDDDVAFNSPLSATISIDPLKDSSVITELTGLQPNTFYYIRFKFNGNADIRQGRFKTFPFPGAPSNFTLVTGSCQETANMKVFDRMKELDPLLMLHTGDYTYPSYQLDDTYPAVYETVQLSWRKRYEEDRMVEMLYTVPIDYIHDDDDGFGVAMNYWTKPKYYLNANNQVVNYFEVDTLPIQGRYNHMRAYTEYFPHYPLVDTSQGLYHKITIGNADIFFLDTRSSARPNHEAFQYNPSTNVWTFNPDTSYTILGHAQKNWLKQELLNSTAKWKFLVCGLPFNKRLKMLIQFGMTFQGSVFNIGGETGTGFRLAASFSNYWAGHIHEQNELLDFITINNLKDIIVISGDTHHNVIDDGTNAGLPELNASGLSVTDLSLAYYINQYSAPLGYPVLDSVWNKGGNGLGLNPNFKNAFGKIDVFGNDSVKLCIVDEDGVAITCYTLEHSSIISTKEHTLKTQLHVFPNPGKGIFNVYAENIQTTQEPIRLYVVNIEGITVKELSTFHKVNNFEFTADLSNLANGIYFIILDSGSHRTAIRILKQ